MKLLPDWDKLVFRDKLHNTEYYNREPKKGRISGRDKNLKIDLNNELRILNLYTKPKGKANKKIILPSNTIDNYTRLKILLGLGFC